MAEKIIATFRMDSNQKAHLQSLAEKAGCTFTDIVVKALQTAVPLPPIVKDPLKELSGGSGIPAGELLNLICIDWQARNFVEQQKFGNCSLIHSGKSVLGVSSRITTSFICS